MIERLSVFSKGLASSIISVQFRDSKATFKIKASDNQQTTTARLISFDLNVDNIEGECGFPIQAFLFGDKIEISCHEKDVAEGEQPMLYLKLKTNLDQSNDDSMIEIWCYSLLTPFE